MALFSKQNKEAFIKPLNGDNPILVQVLGICSAGNGIYIVRVAGRSVFLNAQSDALYSCLLYTSHHPSLDRHRIMEDHGQRIRRRHRDGAYLPGSRHDTYRLVRCV